MKAAIVTICDPKGNYGNRLQNYAVQMVLTLLEMDVVTLFFEDELLTFKSRIKYLLQKNFNYKLPGDTLYWKYSIPKIARFQQFNQKYIKAKRIKSTRDAVDLAVEFYIVGSDQVWNPKWYDSNPLKKDMYLLTFVKDEQKVCFSPSFGLSQIPKQWIPYFKECLSTFPQISVREDIGAKIVKELTGKEAEVLIDPTMMLDASEWMKISKVPKRVDCEKSYILTYFLGGRSKKINEDLEKYARENNLVVYNLSDIEQPDLYISDPSEFVYLIANASLIMTDSFHACVFSFLFKKPFLVYMREGSENGMMSRIETLLAKFDLERKFVDSGLDNEIFECNYLMGYNQLMNEREKVVLFLKKSMNLELY